LWAPRVGRCSGCPGRGRTRTGCGPFGELAGKDADGPNQLLV
jgi:hypothetical protein